DQQVRISVAVGDVQNLHGSGVVGVGVPPVRQICANHFADGCNFVGHGHSVAVAFRQEQVAVGVYAAAESEIGAGEKTKIRLREDAKLEDGNTHRFDVALKLHFRTTDGASGDGQGIGSQQADEALVGA